MREPWLESNGDFPKILVTGSGGLVGTALRAIMPPGCVHATRSTADLTSFEETLALFQQERPDAVIHLAAEVAGIGGNLIHSGEYFRNNMLINMNVLECARLVGVQKLISFMSTCVFPEKAEYPLNEKNLHAGPPHPSNFGYAFAKRMLEVQSLAYRKEWNCNYIVAIPTNIYGPNDYWNLTEGHVIPSLIHKCYLAREHGTDLICWGTGSPLREFVISNDIAKLTLWALKNYREESPIILTSGEEISIRELVEHVVECLNFKGRVVWDSTKPEGQFRKPSDPSKLRGYLPDFKFTPIRDGIRSTVDWFLSNLKNLRV